MRLKSQWAGLIFIVILGCIFITADYANISSTDKNINTSKVNDQNIILPNLYTNRASRYKIKYPANWIYDDKDKGTVVFSGQKDTLDYYATVNIQTVLTKRFGGEYSSMKDLLDDIRKQVLKESPQTTFLGSGAYVLNQKDGSKLNGEYLKFIYSYKGQIIEQWQVVIPRKDGQVFYTWAYTAPIDQI